MDESWLDWCVTHLKKKQVIVFPYQIRRTLGFLQNVIGTAPEFQEEVESVLEDILNLTAEDYANGAAYGILKHLSELSALYLRKYEANTGEGEIFLKTLKLLARSIETDLPKNLTLRDDIDVRINEEVISPLLELTHSSSSEYDTYYYTLRRDIRIIHGCQLIVQTGMYDTIGCDGAVGLEVLPNDECDALKIFLHNHLSSLVITTDGEDIQIAKGSTLFNIVVPKSIIVDIQDSN